MTMAGGKGDQTILIFEILYIFDRRTIISSTIRINEAIISLDINILECPGNKITYDGMIIL